LNAPSVRIQVWDLIPPRTYSIQHGSAWDDRVQGRQLHFLGCRWQCLGTTISILYIYIYILEWILYHRC
jgi:hypothetical protein